MASDDLLVFDYPGLASRSEAFFSDLRDSEELTREFVSNPAGVLTERVLPLPEPLTPSETERTNRFLYSLLSSPGFMEWAEGWQRRQEERINAVGEGEDARLEVRIDRDELFRELANAIVEHGDEAVAEQLADLDLSADEEVQAGEAPEALRLAESELRIPRPKPVNFNVAVNATVAASVAGAVAVVLAVVVVIPVVVVGVVDPQAVDREDLRRLAGVLNAEIKHRAEELRDEGELGPGTTPA